MTEPSTTAYRQRPLEAEALQWTGTNADDLRAFAGSDFDTIDPQDRIEDEDQDAQLLVEDSHWVGIGPGDWVLRFQGYFVAKADAAFRSVWEPAVSSPAPADRAAEIEKLRTENARMRHELEVMYGGAFDSLHSAQPADRAELRDRIMTALDNAHHTHPCPHTGRPYWLGCVHPDGGVGSCHTGRRADAVLSVLPAPAEAEFELRGTAEIRAAAFDEAAGKLGADYPPESGYDRGRAWVIEELRRLAGEARDERETQAEDPARIDRLRPEFTDHASIESIDVQIRRARSQLRRWHLRVEWLISLRQARVTQKELGEWPAAVSQPDHKPDAETQQPEAAEGAQQ